MYEKVPYTMKKLDAQELLKTAQERTGLADFGPDDFMEGFKLVIEGINNDAHIRDSFSKLTPEECYRECEALTDPVREKTAKGWREENIMKFCSRLTAS